MKKHINKIIKTDIESLFHNYKWLDGKKRKLLNIEEKSEPNTLKAWAKLRETFKSWNIDNYEGMRKLIEPWKMGGYYYKNHVFTNKHIKDEIHCIDMSSAYLGGLLGWNPVGDFIKGDTNELNVLKLLKINCKFKPNGKKQIKKLYYMCDKAKKMLKDFDITEMFDDKLDKYDNIYLTNWEYNYLKNWYDFDIKKIECIGYFKCKFGYYDKIAEKLYKNRTKDGKIFSLIMIGMLGHKNIKRDKGYKPYTPLNIAITAKTRIKQWMKSDEIIRDGGQITHMVLDSIYWINGYHNMSQYKEKKLGEYSLALPEGCDEMIMFSSQGYAIKKQGQLMKVAHGFMQTKEMVSIQERILKSILYNLPLNQWKNLKDFLFIAPLNFSMLLKEAFYV